MDTIYLQFVSIIVEALHRLDIRYAIGGSLATSIYGEIHFTYSVDIAIQLTAEKILALVKIYEDLAWYVFPEGIEKAVQRGGEFQVIDGSSGLKADFYATPPALTPRQQRPLDRAQLRSLGYGDQRAWVMSPEDAVLYKLEWYLMGKSEKHLRDISTVLTQLRETFDFAYMDQWVEEIHAHEIWEKAAREYRRRNGDE